MVVVFRMAPQAALLEQSLAVGHRHPADSTTRARRAWSPSVPAGTLQETTPGQWPAGDHPPVHRAGKSSERRPPRDFWSSRPRGLDRKKLGGHAGIWTQGCGPRGISLGGLKSCSTPENPIRW